MGTFDVRDRGHGAPAGNLACCGFSHRCLQAENSSLESASVVSGITEGGPCLAAVGESYRQNRNDSTAHCFEPTAWGRVSQFCHNSRIVAGQVFQLVLRCPEVTRVFWCTVDDHQGD